MLHCVSSKHAHAPAVCAGGLLHRGRPDQQLQQQQQLLALQQQQQHVAAQQLQQQLAAQQLLAEHRQQQQQSRRSSKEGAVPTPVATSAPLASSADIKFEDLELRRVVGTGQFGLVRVVRHLPTNAVYALKVGGWACVWQDGVGGCAWHRPLCLP